jgi:hypothetical protein
MPRVASTGAMTGSPVDDCRQAVSPPATSNKMINVSGFDRFFTT